MRRNDQPSWPSAITCSFLSSPKTLLTARKVILARVSMSCPIPVGRFSGVPHWPVLGVPRGFYAQCFHHSLQRELRRAVHRLERERDQADDGADVHDVAATLLVHVGEARRGTLGTRRTDSHRFGAAPLRARCSLTNGPVPQYQHCSPQDRSVVRGRGLRRRRAEPIARRNIHPEHREGLGAACGDVPYMRKPRSARLVAQAWSMPEEAPVMRTTRGGTPVRYHCKAAGETAGIVKIAQHITAFRASRNRRH